MITTAEIADRVGRKKIAEAVGVGLTAVSNAVVRGTFSSSWYYAVLSLCREAGIECPLHLFNMRGDIPQGVDYPGALQEADEVTHSSPSTEGAG